MNQFTRGARACFALLMGLMVVAGCGSDEPRLSPVEELTQNSSEVVVDEPVADSLTPDAAAVTPGETSAQTLEPPADPLADVESSVVVPNVEINFLLGAESACVGALALTPSGQLSTPGFTYDDKTCRKLIDSIPIPDLPKNDIETAYLRGFQEMLGIMFRPGQLCAPTGECFTKDQVLPVQP